MDPTDRSTTRYAHCHPKPPRIPQCENGFYLDTSINPAVCRTNSCERTGCTSYDTCWHSNGDSISRGDCTACQANHAYNGRLRTCTACSSTQHVQSGTFTDAGYAGSVVTETCATNVCTCPNGFTDSCTSHNTQICDRCQTGYHLSNNNCVLNQCTCPNGGSASGSACPTHGQHLCTSCSQTGYGIENGICVLQTPQSGCGTDKFIAEGAVFTSDNHPNDYSNNKICEWRLEAGSNKYIVIRVNAFNLESESTCRWDDVIFDYGGTATEKYCNVLTTPQFRGYKNHEQTVRFKTDGSVVRSGFSMQWYKFPSGSGSVHDTSACDGSKVYLMDMNGSIQSLGSQYVDNLNCNWYIGRHATDPTVYEFRITEFAIEAQSSCSYDHLQITGGGNSICSDKCCDGKVNFSTGTWYQWSGVLRVNFKTDYSVQRNGWKIEWRARSGSPGRMASGRFMSKPKVYPGYKDFEPEIPFKDVWLKNHEDELKDIPLLEDFTSDELQKPSGEMVGGPWNQKYIPSWQRDRKVLEEQERKAKEQGN